MIYKPNKPVLPSFQQLVQTIDRERVRPPLNARRLPRHDIDQECFEFFVHFFSTSENLFLCLRRMKGQFNKYNNSSPPPQNVLMSKNTWAAREDFRRFVAEIPNEMAGTIARGMYRLSQILTKMKDPRLHRLLPSPQVPRSNHKIRSFKVTKPFRTPLLFPRSPMDVKKRSKTASVCSHCTIKATPEWRKGPNGSRSLCNACGLFYSKLVKRFGAKDASVIFYYRRDSDASMDRTIPSEEDKNCILKEVSKNFH